MPFRREVKEKKETHTYILLEYCRSEFRNVHDGRIESPCPSRHASNWLSIMSSIGTR